ncbi:hypothetical protein ACJX0J_027026 [Zea mays]
MDEPHTASSTQLTCSELLMQQLWPQQLPLINILCSQEGDFQMRLQRVFKDGSIFRGPHLQHESPLHHFSVGQSKLGAICLCQILFLTPMRFHFESFWTRFEGFHDAVSNAWHFLAIEVFWDFYMNLIGSETSGISDFLTQILDLFGDASGAVFFNLLLTS